MLARVARATCFAAVLSVATGAHAQQAVSPKVVEGTQMQPAYPDTARRLGIEGTTTLRVFVMADGHVADVALVKSAGHPDLDQAAADAVRRWRFEPARRGGNAVPMTVTVPITFKLGVAEGPPPPIAPGPLSRMWTGFTPDKAGMVYRSTGDVVVQRVGRSTPVRVKSGDDVFLQDLITTGEGAPVELALGDKMYLAVRERSVITISEIPGRGIVDVQSGEIMIAMRGDHADLDGFEARGPNAVAVARAGTRLRVTVQRTPVVVTSVDVLDGRATVAIHADMNNPLYRGAPSGIEVGASQGITITGETPGPIRSLAITR